MDYYNKGGTKNPHLDKLIEPLGLTAREKADLVAFMRALTGEIALEALGPELPQ